MLKKRKAVVLFLLIIVFISLIGIFRLKEVTLNQKLSITDDLMLNVSKGESYKSLINDLSKQAFFSDLKSNYERDTLFKCFCWPKSIEEDPENLGELNKNNIIDHVISLCKNQPHDELIISYNMFDVDDWSYTKKNAYSCRCSDISQVRRTINYILKKLQKFPFKSFNEFIDYKEKYNSLREEYGVTYVKIEFMSDVDDY